jgi:hypothetical protein
LKTLKASSIIKQDRNQITAGHASLILYELLKCLGVFGKVMTNKTFFFNVIYFQNDIFISIGHIPKIKL